MFISLGDRAVRNAIQQLMMRFWWLWVRLFKLEQFKCRQLTRGEIELCQGVFGDLIDYAQARIMNHPFLPWQPNGILMAPMGSLQLKPADYVADFSKENIHVQAVFIHEMAHVYQYQQNLNVLYKGALLQSAYYLSLKYYNPYQYRLSQAKPYLNYNIEQQGDIAKDIFLNKIENIIKK